MKKIVEVENKRRQSRSERPVRGFSAGLKATKAAREPHWAGRDDAGAPLPSCTTSWRFFDVALCACFLSAILLHHSSTFLVFFYCNGTYTSSSWVDFAFRGLQFSILNGIAPSQKMWLLLSHRGKGTPPTCQCSSYFECKLTGIMCSSQLCVCSFDPALW